MGWFIRGKIVPEHKNPINKFLQFLYKPIIYGATNTPKIILIIAIILVGVGLWPLTQLGKEFMPTLDEGDILYMPTTLPSIAIDETRKILQRTDKLISSIPEVKTVFGKAGRAETATDPAQLSMFETVIQLKPQNEWRSGMTMDKIIQELDTVVKIPGLTNAWVMPIRTRIDMLSTGIKTPIGIKIFGPDLSIVQKLGSQIEAIIKKIPETAIVYAERVSGGRYISIDIDRVKAARYGLNITDIQTIIQSAIGGENIGQTIEGRERYPINIRYPREIRDSVAKLQWLPIVTPTKATVPLGEIAQIKIEDGPDMIHSENARINGLVFIDTTSSDLAGYIKKAQLEIANKVKLPPGYSMVWSGQYEYMERAKQHLLYVAPFTLAIIALLLYFCFGRLTEVIIILISLPLSLIGGIWIVYLLGYNISVAVSVGFIALAGVSAETGVIMLIYLNHALEERRQLVKQAHRKLTNQDIQTAIIEGSLLRLRPKIMTVCAIIGGLLPIMIFSGTGSEMIRHIAAPMIGGMLSSMILTLVVIPCLYLVWNQYQNAKK